METTVTQHVAHNRAVHDQVAASYEQTHVEIFNPTEQARLAAAITSAVGAIRTGVTRPTALDFGAGTGNLTSCLLKAGADVVASDVSPRMLREIETKHPGEVTVMDLNGVDLRDVQDATFDMVATYSVLHHVVDYLAILREFVRVTKPGGVLYLDHEVTPGYWSPTASYEAYRAELRAATDATPRRDALRRTARNLVSPTAWRRLVNRKLRGIVPLDIEGDVHVTPNDHIEWGAIDAVVRPACELVHDDDYLVCREADPTAPIYRRYKDTCTDMRVRTYRRLR